MREAGAVILSTKVKKVPVSHVVKVVRPKQEKNPFCVAHTLTALEIPAVGKTPLGHWVFVSHVVYKDVKRKNLMSRISKNALLIKLL